MGWILAGRTALITGAARGLGAGLATRLGNAGMNLILAGLEPELLTDVATPFKERALVIEADVTSLEQMRNAVHKGVKRFGGIDVAVANAGITAMAPLAEIDPEKFRQIIDVNLFGVFNTLSATAESVFAQQGYFLVVSSMAYAIQSPLQAHYTASKAAVTALANSFRLEARAAGADVGVIHPTFANTDLMTFTHNSPGGKEIWNSNTGIWKMVDADKVVQSMEQAIRKRRRTTVVPKTLWPLVLAPGIFQPVLERSFSVSRVNIMLDAFRSSATKNKQPEKHS